MLCFQSVLYCIVLYNDVFTFLYVAVGNKLLLLLRTFGLTNLRNEEPFISDYRTFGLESSHPQDTKRKMGSTVGKQEHQETDKEKEEKVRQSQTIRNT